MPSYQPKIAYLCMGAFLEPDMPTYSGGLEILAADLLRTCADLEIPIVGFILACNHGYAAQDITKDGLQIERPIDWAPEKSIRRISKIVTIKNRGRKLHVTAEEYIITGRTGFKVPIYLLDTNIEINTEEDRKITGRLYTADPGHRIEQENVLGRAAVRLSRELGYHSIKTYHMNEGHACFATLELLEENSFKEEEVRKRCIFTTHTPVAAGHDIFSYEEMGKVVGGTMPERIKELAGKENFNTTKLAVSLSRHINAVSKRHRDVCRNMDVFKGKDIDYITNGIHSITWTSEPFARLFTKHIPDWEEDPLLLLNSHKMPLHEIAEAKEEAKRSLMIHINKNYDTDFNKDSLTIVWARRFTSYKRPTLLFRDIQKLAAIAEKHGDIQLVFSGKSHARDKEGTELILDVFQKTKVLHGRISTLFIPNYDADIAKLLASGADIWLNTPRRPQEACGTSGMKAVHNGTIMLSTYDGWWIEALELEPDAGWIIGKKEEKNAISAPEQQKIEDEEDAESLYAVLPGIIDMYYNNKRHWQEKMRKSISLAGHFNTHRMVHEYRKKMWNITAERQKKIHEHHLETEGYRR